MMNSLAEKMTKTVVIAEDDDAIAELISQSLYADGYVVHRFHDGIDALNGILQIKPDLIVLDLSLPRLQGYDLCAMVRRTPSVHRTPIIVVSGRMSVPDRLKAFELGADDYVTKPFDMDELVARVEAVLMRSRQRRFPTPFLDHWN
jgi:two-component system alkaline phosphatase synthesis response regulator PhoP